VLVVRHSKKENRKKIKNAEQRSEPDTQKTSLRVSFQQRGGVQPLSGNYGS
jgi:hypothetical protein